MLMPKRVKRRKQFRGSMRGKALRGNKINYGEFGLVATEPCCFDLVRSDPTWFHCYKTIFTVRDLVSS